MYTEVIELDPISLFTKREAYEFFGICSDLGGIIEVFYVVAAAIVGPFAAVSFDLKAIYQLCDVKCSQKIEEISFFETIRYFTKVFANKRYKKLFLLGKPVLDLELDIVNIL